MTEQWTYAGVNLETVGVSRVKLLSAVDGLPNRAGANVAIPGRQGRAERYQAADERVIGLGLTIEGATRAALDDNLDAILGALGTEGRQTLTRTLADGGTRTIQAEIVNALAVRYESDRLATAVVELLAEPWWTIGSLTQVVSAISSSLHVFEIDNPGTAEHTAATIYLNGNITNPKLTIGDVWLQYTGAVTGTLTWNCGTFTTDGGYGVGNVSHGGSPYWMVIPPGVSEATLTGSSISGSPSITMEFYGRMW